MLLESEKKELKTWARKNISGDILISTEISSWGQRSESDSLEEGIVNQKDHETLTYMERTPKTDNKNINLQLHTE